MMWGRKVDAANAWNVRQRYGSAKFSEQSRFIVVPVKLLPLEKRVA